MNIKEVLFKLSSLDSVGAVHDAADYAAEELKKYAEVERRGAAVIGKIKGAADYTVLLDAHIDQVAFTVTDIDGEGFITEILPRKNSLIRPAVANVVPLRCTEKRIFPLFFAAPRRTLQAERWNIPT
mgnify:CR=1 FL=1